MSATSWTLEKACDRAMQTAWHGTPNERSMAFSTRQIMRYFGRKKKLTAVNIDAVDRFISKLRKGGNKNGTINRKLAALSKVLRIAHERDGVPRLIKIRYLPEPQGRVRCFSHEEERQLLRTFRAWGKHDHADIVVCLVDTGVRISELLRLEARDVDLETGIVSIWHTKTNQPRSVPVTSRVRSILKTRLRRASTGRERLFPYRYNWFQYHWAHARRHLGYSDDPQYIPHALRHTCASRLVRGGASILVVQQWLGHRSLKMTMRYSHLAPHSLVEAVNILEHQSDGRRRLAMRTTGVTPVKTASPKVDD